MANMYSNHGKQLMVDTFSEQPNIKIMYAKEFLTHCSFEKSEFPKDIWDMYVCIYRTDTKLYTYYHYNTEYNNLDNYYNLKYTLYSKEISSKYLVTPNSFDKNIGDTHPYICSVIRIVHKIGGIEYEWNKINKQDLYNVRISLNNVGLDPFKVIEIPE